MFQTRKRPKLDSTSPSIGTKCISASTPAVVSVKQADKTEEKTGTPLFNATILLVKEGIQEKRFGLITKFAEKNGFQCEEQFSERVSYVVTDLGDLDQICRLHPHLASIPLTPVVSSRWLYASVKEKNQVPTASFLVPGYDVWQAGVRQTPPHQQPIPEPQQPTPAPQPTLEPQQPTVEPPQPVANTLQCFNDTSSAPLPSLLKNINQYPVTPVSSEAVTFDKEAFNNNPLERNAPLTHHNQKLVEPLTFLSNYWSTLGDEQRSLAYTTAAATLKCLPFTATSTSQIADLKGVGSGHCLKVLREILDTGSCQEIIVKRQSEKYLRIKNLTGVYGVGISLAEKLHNSHGITNVTDMVARWEDLNLHDERIKYGVAYYDDLNTPVTREMGDRIQAIVRKELDGIREGCRLELTGGFRRQEMDVCL